MLKRFLVCSLCVFALHKIVFWTKPFGALLEENTFSKSVWSRDEQLLRLTLNSKDQYKIFTPLTKISPLIIESTLLYEDRYFKNHIGINPISMLRAFWSTYVKKTRVLGASTLTMQVARQKYGLHTRSISGKLKQIFYALFLEFCYSKNEILQSYFNLVPYGFNIQGIGAASWIYLNKAPDKLSLLEAITFSVIPQDPNKRIKTFFAEGVLDKNFNQARMNLWNMWLKQHPENVDIKSLFTMELKLRSPRILPFKAPHVTQYLLSEHNGRIHSTIDLASQKLVEEMLQSYIAKNKSKGLVNASAMLVDSRNMQVLASVGSADFNNQAIHGQVDGTRARRSPGSTLKPFAYALAIEQGLIHSHSLLKDTPSGYFGTYTPDNFDKEYAGPMSATEALIHSRNVPAVHITSLLKEPSLHEFLLSSGLPLVKDPKHYGTSIVLGTAEVTMQELLQLYGALANGGQQQKLQYLMSTKANVGDEILSAEASFIVSEMLSHNPMPEYSYGERWVENRPRVAWKTGTSVGFRDAWAVGIFDHYILAVWVGNFNGKGNPAFVGRRAAGPLFFSIIEGLNAMGVVEQREFVFHPKLKLQREEVCAQSGQLPHAHCPHRTQALFIPGVSPIEKCQVHRSIPVTDDEKYRVCPEIEVANKNKVYEFWSSDVLDLYQQAGIGRQILPSFHPKCKQQSLGGRQPRILSPKEGIVYNLRSKGTGTKELPLIAMADADAKKLSWYVDGRYFAKSSPDQTLLWKALSGKHQLQVFDEQGRSADVNIEVKRVD